MDPGSKERGGDEGMRKFIDKVLGFERRSEVLELLWHYAVLLAMHLPASSQIFSCMTSRSMALRMYAMSFLLPERHEDGTCAADPDLEEDDHDKACEEFEREVVAGTVECILDQLSVFLQSITQPNLRL